MTRAQLGHPLCMPFFCLASFQITLFLTLLPQVAQ